MPWMERDTMSLRREFVELASHPSASIAALARRFGISRKTAYKWLDRANQDAFAGLANLSRRPKRTPTRTDAEMEQKVVALRREFHWGGRKLHAYLRNRDIRQIPAPSTITHILHRHGMIAPEQSAKRQHYRAFAREYPNALWQMDFKGHFGLNKGRCHPLTVLDDHSRFALGLQACGDEQRGTVQARLVDLFRRYGLPEAILCDNGPPWGYEAGHRHTRLTAWWMRLGIRPLHGKPYHPQTQGKDERFHRTLDEELLQHKPLTNLQACQAHFDRWRQIYNHDRPHEALNMQVPASRYRISPREYPEVLAPIEYSTGDVRKVDPNGTIRFKSRRYSVGKAFIGLPVATRETLTDGSYDVYFCSFIVRQINLSQTADD
jgi:transposase InsO family protein